MNSRAVSANTSLQAKKELVRLLFGSQHHQLLDNTQYTYDHLRTTYLERIQQLHPDKYHGSIHKQRAREEAKRLFVELKDAWKRYEEVAKLVKRVNNGKEGCFTMFGVGCSFSDSEAERALRSEIMDQACRGWFSAGALTDRRVHAEVRSSSLTYDTDVPQSTLFTQLDDDIIMEAKVGATDISARLRDSPRRTLVSDNARLPKR